MSELLCSKYIPFESLVVKRYSEDFDDYRKKGYDIRKYYSKKNLYLITKPPMLEMVFREGDRDFVFNMINEAYSFFKTNKISNSDASRFAFLIASGEIKVTILPDGSYTLK